MRKYIYLSIIAFSVLFLFIMHRSIVRADSQGAKFPSTAANDATVGTVDWASISNIEADDGVVASISGLSSGGASHYAVATNFGFSIPAGATINGIQVTVKKARNSSGTVVDNSVKLVKGGVISGNDKADTSTNWSATLTNTTYGSASDLWGLSFTAADINASNFGVAFSGTESVAGPNPQQKIDAISITVTYTPVAGQSGTQMMMSDDF